MMILQKFLLNFFLTTQLSICMLLGQAQNLVPNGGFEEGNCVGYPGNLVESDNWYSSLTPGDGITPEWFHECIDDQSFSPPSVAFGDQIPFDQGYAGLVNYFFNQNVSNGREIIGVQLFEPLAIGNLYAVDFKFSPITTVPQIAILTNNFGFNFSTHQFYNLDAFPINTSHFSIDSIVPLSEPDEWYEISMVFEADSAYQYLHIGNFYSDDETTAIFNSENAFISYYVVDEVSVSLTLSTSESFYESKFSIYPNPVAAKLFLSLDNPEATCNVSILNLDGVNLFQTKFFGTINQESIDVGNLAPGCYILTIETPKLTIHEKFIKI